MITDVLQRAIGNAIVLKNLPGQRRIPYLSTEERARLRDRRIHATVQYAAETVPFYRNFFRARGIHPSDIQTAKDLDNLPIISRESFSAQRPI